MHRPIHISSSALDSNSPFGLPSSPLPLTTENLMTLEDNLDKNESFTNEILSRYCLDMITTNNTLQQVKLDEHNKPSYRDRCQSTPPQIQRNDDVVVASPRLLPFPYHNDSMFLPTAEKIQYQHFIHSSSARTSSSRSSHSTSRADSSSLLPSESEFLVPRPHSTNTNIIPNSISTQSFTSSDDRQLFERRSLPINLDYSNIVISKSGSRQQQQRFLRRSSTFGSNSTLTQKSVVITGEKKSWLKRILKLFNHNSNKKSKHNKNQKPQHQEKASDNDGMDDQVWYCQYSKNPSTNFKNSYYHHQYQHQRPMISVS